MQAKQVSGRKVRYGVVGAGWIAQGYFMPGVAHTGNSEITAIVTGDPEKGRKLGKDYDVAHVYDYSEFSRVLADDVVDALYVATPNWRHTEFVVPALEAGIHVLLEKPMAIGLADCEKMMAAAKASGAKLMIAYRLHFEPGTIEAIDMVRRGKLGEIMYFGSTFAQKVKPSNHRAQNGYEAGPVYDMGPYPINAVRNLFGAEPLEVSATGLRRPGAGLGDLDDTVYVTLKFAEGKVAQFMMSYSLDAIDEYHVSGTKGFLLSKPAFQVGMQIEHFLTRSGKDKHETYKETDHFGGETRYFSECILENREPECDGEEGWCDVRVIEAIRQSIETGRPVALAPYRRKRRIETDQVMKLSPVSVPKMVDAGKPAA